MEKNKKQNNANVNLVQIITAAIQIPGVKVDRKEFLRKQFSEVTPEKMQQILEVGPVAAHRTRSELQKKSKKLIADRTSASSVASFAAGMPGGLAMAATIPADVLQFYGVALRLAQEVAYLYGADDLWMNGAVDDERVMNRLVLYCGVMLGASGAAQTVRVMSSALAKQALKKIPQQALTKTFYYPIIKSICKAFGVKMTKEVFAKSVSKALPVIGGFISGGITLATMLPMGNRLAAALDEANFEYTEDDFNEDWEDIVEVIEKVEAEEAAETKESSAQKSEGDVLEKIQKAKSMLDAGIITEEEFSAIKSRLIAEM